MKILLFNNLWVLVLLCCISMLTACGSSDDGDTTDGDTDLTESETEDGDIEQTSDGDLETDGDEDLATGTTISETDVVIGVAMGAVLTPSAQTTDQLPGDGTWQSVENFLTDEDISNFAYTAEGLEFGYGDLSEQVQVTTSQFKMPASNGSLLENLQGPFDSRTQVKVEEETYIYIYMTDNDVKYYLRMYYDHKSGLGLHVTYDFSTDPTFP